jgi:hypothetical protein
MIGSADFILQHTEHKDGVLVKNISEDEDIMCKKLFYINCSFLGELKITFILIVGIMLFIGSHSLAKDTKMQFNIPSQNLRSALIEFANVTDLSLVYDIEGLGNKESKAIYGVYTPLEALGIILNDTGLTFEKTGDGSIALKKKINQNVDTNKNYDRSPHTSNQSDVMTNKKK